MNIYIVRHGQSTQNLPSHKSGTEDRLISLTEQGTKEALRVGRFLGEQISSQDYDSSVILTSTYLRAKQTTKGIQNSLPLKTFELGYLREIDRGLFGDKSFEDCGKIYGNLYTQVQKKLRSPQKFFVKFPEGESAKDLLNRLKPLKQVLNSLEEKQVKNVVIVTHSDTMRVLLCLLMGYNADWYAKEYGMMNCSVRKLEKHKENYKDFGYVYRGYQYFKNKILEKEKQEDLCR